MRTIVTALLVLCLGPVSALAEVRPLQRPAGLAMPDAPLLRPLRRAGAVTPDPRALVEAALQPLPDPAPLVLPDAAVAAATLSAAPRQRLADIAPPRDIEVILSASNASRLPAAPPAFLAAAPPPLGPRSRDARGAPGAAIAPPVRSSAATLVVPRPPARPAASAPLANAAVPVMLRPAKRPKGLAARRATAPDVAVEVAPEVLVQTAALRVRPGEALVRPKKGSVCGDPDIRGETLAPIPAKMKGCGIADPVRVTEVDGVRLSTPATLDCDAARALKTWIERGLKPAATGAKVKGLVIAASYSCRPRNNVKGAKVSEHGRGNAIDIAGVVLADGRTLDVLRDYRGTGGAILRRAHKAACGPFATTLGPGSDGYHENHLHFDVASHRSGSYCR